MLCIVMIIGYTLYQNMQADDLRAKGRSILALQNIAALSTDESGCPPSSKATRKWIVEDQVDEQVCSIRGALDYIVKSVEEYRHCDFSPEGVICCDEMIGLISKTEKSRESTSCIHAK